MSLEVVMELFLIYNSISIPINVNADVLNVFIF